MLKTMMRIWRNGKKRRKGTTKGQIHGKEYRTTVLVPAKVMEKINGYLSAPVIKCKKTPRKKCSFVAERRKKR